MATLPRTFLLPFLALSSLALACTGSSGEAASQESAVNSDGGKTVVEDAGAGDAAAAPDAAPVDCSTIAPAPLAPRLIGRPFTGSEDFAFDGQGHIVAKRGNSVIRVSTTPGEESTTLASLPGQTFGLRYHLNGDLIAALPGPGKVVAINPSGQVKELLTGLSSPNGIYPDFDGNVWITEFGGSKVVRLAPDGTQETIVSGTNAQAANGVVLDAKKKILFYTEYSKGQLNRISVDAQGETPTVVATIPGAALDGIVLDACGNVYAVDQGSSRIFRVRIDANGNAPEAPELLATFPSNVANAQFGAGPGFDPKTLYVTGNPGAVYALAVGVEGAPVPQPPVPQPPHP